MAGRITAARLEDVLRERLAARFVEVVDESQLHAGHAGARQGGGHFRVTIVSDRFDGMPAVARQRLVYQALVEEMKRDVHALSMRTFSPAQWADRITGSREASC